MGAQERGDAAVVTRAGKTQARGGGSHLQWVGTQERGEVAAVIRSGWARGERSKAWLLMGERRGGMKQNNYQPVMLGDIVRSSERLKV